MAVETLSFLYPKEQVMKVRNSFPKSFNHLRADDLILQAEDSNCKIERYRPSDVQSLRQMMIKKNKSTGV